MNYLNFFENAQSEKKGINVPVISVALIVSAGIVLAGMYAVSNSRLKDESDCLDYLTAVENDPTFSRRYTLEKQIETRVNQAQEDCVFLGVADCLIDAGSTVSRELVEELASCFPANTKIVRLSVSKDTVTLEGVAENLNAMISAERALLAKDSIGSVFIDSAKEDGHEEENGTEAVTFNCRVVLSEKGNGENT